MTEKTLKAILAARHCVKGGECGQACPIGSEDACLSRFRDALLELDTALRVADKELLSLTMHIESVHVEALRWSGSVLKIAREKGEKERKRWEE